MGEWIAHIVVLIGIAISIYFIRLDLKLLKR